MHLYVYVHMHICSLSIRSRCGSSADCSAHSIFGVCYFRLRRPTMNGYFCSACVRERPGESGVYVLTSVLPGVYESYKSDSLSVRSFRFPMGYLRRDAAFVYMTLTELLADLVASGGDYWIGRVYRNNRGGLDLYVQFKGDETMYHYELFLPCLIRDAETMRSGPDGWGGIYPAPWQWTYAVGYRTIRTYPFDEWSKGIDEP